MNHLTRVLEAMLFASDKPLSASECVKYLKGAVESAPEDADIAALAKTKQDDVAVVLRELQAAYEEQQRGFRVVESAAGWKVVTAPDAAPWVRQLFPENRPARLSPSALETLAIVAYRQPIARADIEAVRGVNVDGVMQTLLERGVIRITGRADVPGRPLLYGTTEFFLEHFGLRSLDELPNCAELRRIELPAAIATDDAQPNLPFPAEGGANGAAESAAEPPQEAAAEVTP
ncbi:MAG: SMC-Scp complex subunit ScpB [Chthoniobacterales bacterium]|nr:SMC-Scp complex subunit ScpB [Chthoniobacterales bacterium]